MSRSCVLGCGRLIPESDGHETCVTCLGVKHAEAGFSDTTCPICEDMSIKVLRSRLATFFGTVAANPLASQASSAAASAKSTASTSSGGDMGTAMDVASPAPARRTAHTPVRSPGASPMDGGRPFHSGQTRKRDDDEISVEASDSCLLASDGDDLSELLSTGGRARDGTDPEMSAMLARAAVSIGLQRANPPSPKRSRLDEWYLGTGRGQKPRTTPVPFFPEVHEELTRSWNAPFSARSTLVGSAAVTSLDGGAARGYVDIPQVERAVAVHLCPQTAATWRGRPRLPSRACKLSSTLVSKAYNAAGQAASALHAMAILQVFQAKVLKDLDEGKPDPTRMSELRTATTSRCERRRPRQAH
ncbi:uncharacterized protein LOC130439813 isoform X1 [Triplophysa dalaica]|uniref:uncharacterized protein LOC130439813 isoform X1 n=1 Tax=Triplophysa dalaica TaxID=1582913 RepID=UPI0024E03CFC|nr:uncharacterized protein LOC130439813 isoform X1 [Triplophysa dalaica]